MKRWLALIAFVLLAPGVVDRAWATPPDPLCIKSGVIQGDSYRICRAVISGHLDVLYFVHHAGVWWLAAVKPAASLPNKPKS